MNNITLESEITKIPTRKHVLNLHIPTPVNEFQKKMLFYRGAKTWNYLPAELKDCHDVNLFKIRLKQHVKTTI